MRSDSANCDKSQINVSAILARSFRKVLAESNAVNGNILSITARALLNDLCTV